MVADRTRGPDALPRVPCSTEEAFAYCHALARRHYENFTVISRLTPRPLRQHRAALYAYCRTVDDLGDEAIGDRLQQLDRWEEQLDAAYRGEARHPVLVALQDTIARYGLPRRPLQRLIEANRIDQRRHRHETFDQLIAYCEHSANPVGQLVLALHGIHDEECISLSDATCTALQLTNFWQDLRRDVAVGRIYLPMDEMAAFDVTEVDLSANRASPNLVRLMQFQIARTHRYFAAGLPLVDRVPGRLKLDLSLFSRGGLAILRKIEQQGHDTLRRRPMLSTSEKAWLIVSTLVSCRRRSWI